MADYKPRHERPEGTATGKQLASEILITARWHGLLAWLAPQPSWVAPNASAGFPDMFLCGPGGAVVREIKGDGDTLSADQRAWGDWLMLAGWDWGVWDWSDWATGVIETTITRLGRAK